MIDTKKRSLQKELLDRDDIPFADIKQNMKELDFINKNLGGHGITIAGFKKLLTKKDKLHICEIGCGGGDNLKAVEKYCSSKNIKITYSGIDINPNCIEYARTKNPDIHLINADYKTVQFESKPDIIFSSLFCHHFTNEQLIEMLQWMKSNSLKGFFINDLHRHPLAYYFIKLMTKLFSKSYLVKNDAPLSVLRGFKKSEWKDLLHQAGISNYSLKWKWAFRYLIIADHGK